MKKAKLELNLKKVPELIQLARHIVTSMTANPSFLTPIPPLADITAKALALETVYEATLEGNHAKVAEMHQLDKELKHMLSFLSSYVDTIALGNEQIILSSGMLVNKDPQHTGVLPAPANVRLEKGTNEGKVFVRYNKVVNAKSYEIDYFEGNPVAVTQTTGGQSLTTGGINLAENLEDIGWEHAGTSTNTKFEITGLTPGNRILVRVAAVSVDGAGTWSDPATIVVP